MDYPRQQHHPEPAAAAPALATRSELAAFTGVAMPTLRAYTEMGLLPLYQEKPGVRWRCDVAEVTTRLAALDVFLQQGLALDEIRRRVGK